MSARLLLAGTHTSTGKTTVALGLLAAWRRRGLRPAPFKAGPDYIDPTLHARAAGRPSRNLDVWLLSEASLRGVLERGLRDADIAVIEGVMGLFDGIGASHDGSTAALARALATPVVLVLDVAGMSGTAAAVVLGCQQIQPHVRIAGVVLNRVGSDGHLHATAEAIRQATGLPTLGSLPDDPSIALPERHLGLVPAAEGGVTTVVLDRLAELVEQRFDLAALERIADAAPSLPHLDAMRQLESPDGVVRIAVAQDRAFGFYYQDAFDVLADCGAEIVPFSPLIDKQVPTSVQGIYIGGGFPEVHVEELSTNVPMRTDLQRHARQGTPIYAECGGLMALGTSLTTFEGRTFPMFGVLPFASRMQRQTVTIGYREVEALRSSALLAAGERVRGHEFHWSVGDEPAAEVAAYRIVGQDRLEGYCIGSVLGSYIHLNFAGRPDVARRYVKSLAGQPATS
jgi:cobyrinic acid a,c-diamide synthase